MADSAVVAIVYAPGDAAHLDAVRDLWILLRAAGFDARLEARDGAGADAVVLEVGGERRAIVTVGDEELAWLRARRAATTVRHELRLRVAVEGSRVRCAVTLAGELVCERDEPLPFGRDEVWDLLDRPDAEARLARLGQRLSRALFDADALDYVTVLLTAGVGGTVLDVVVEADGPAHELPFELLRLSDQRVLVAVDGVRLTRMVSGVRVPRHPASPGPLKILVAVGAPERTANPPLDVEAEMQAIVSVVGGVGRAEITILEVAGVAEIAEALRRDAYHVLHLSAHGSPYGVELEDRDGNAVDVRAEDLVRALRRGGRPLPLIVLSSCGGAADADAGLAVTLLRHGADRVLAMQTSITDWYATRLLTGVYRALAEDNATVAAAVARARAELFDATAGAQPPKRPEYAVPALFAASDGPLWDGAAPAVHLQNPTDLPTGAGVRELLLGDLVGRRGLLRVVTQTLRDEIVAGPLVNGVVLTGPAGIGKTALAGRVVGRLRDDADPWAIVVHAGAWNPPRLFEDLAAAGVDARDPGELAEALHARRILLVFDDFEQNLTLGGDAFADPGFGEVFATLAAAAERGKILVTSRYPVPGAPALSRVDVGPLGDAELVRLMLRLPGLRELSTEDMVLIMETVGGHPRLVEFVDALLHGGARLPEVTERLRTLSGGERFERAGASEAARRAVALGAQDVLLTELLDLAGAAARETLLQVAVSRIAMSTEDLAFAALGREPSTEDTAAVAAHLDRLRDLTLVRVSEDGAVVEPWLREALTKAQGDRLAERHARAAAACRRLVDAGRADFATALEGAYHLSGDELADFAGAVLAKLSGEVSVAAFLGDVTERLPARHPAYLSLLTRERDALEAIGSTAAAAEKGEEAVAITGRAAKAGPGDAGAQVALSAALDSQGRLLHRLGRLADARRAYERALEIDTRLAAADPDDLQLRRNVGLSRLKLVRVALDDSDPDRARTAAAESLRIRRELAATDPQQGSLQWDLAVCLGTVAETTGPEQARPLLEEALGIWRQLASGDPDNGALQSNLFDCLYALADLDAERFRDLTLEAAAIADRLTDADSGNTGFQRRLLRSYWRLGDMDLRAGDLACAAGHFAAATTLAQRLADDDTGSVDAQRDLATALRRQADYALANARPEEVRGHLERSAEVTEALVHRFPRTGALHRDLAESRERLGDWLRDTGEPVLARALYRLALASRRRRAVLDPEDTASRLAQAEVHARIAALDEAAGHRGRARRQWQEAVELARVLDAGARRSYFEQRLAATS
ncbi:CHAT domain-containing protein [Dactylosporangium sp. CA-052675]|uniref:CHAT domain-containing protein n=1 Tax=Dactylosporangium sp. CA-052675 TaxID=3239927 RepID=UPI003D8E208C